MRDLHAVTSFFFGIETLGGILMGDEQETIISLQHVCKEFDGTTVVDDFNLEVKRGEFITILGRPAAERPRPCA